MLLFKDNQLQEAQGWMARSQELDLYVYNLNIELRDRNDQLNQLWIGFQRQVYALGADFVLTIRILLRVFCMEMNIVLPYLHNSSLVLKYLRLRKVSRVSHEDHYLMLLHFTWS